MRRSSAAETLQEMEVRGPSLLFTYTEKNQPDLSAGLMLRAAGRSGGRSGGRLTRRCIAIAPPPPPPKFGGGGGGGGGLEHTPLPPPLPSLS